MRGFCSATSINRRTLHRPGDVFICAEHPVAERCGNGVAVYFDFCLGTLMVTFVCAPSVEVFVHSSVCVCGDKVGTFKRQPVTVRLRVVQALLAQWLRAS